MQSTFHATRVSTNSSAGVRATAVHSPLSLRFLAGKKCARGDALCRNYSQDHRLSDSGNSETTGNALGNELNFAVACRLLLGSKLRGTGFQSTESLGGES